MLARQVSCVQGPQRVGCFEAAFDMETVAGGQGPGCIESKVVILVRNRQVHMLVTFEGLCVVKTRS